MSRRKDQLRQAQLSANLIKITRAPAPGDDEEAGQDTSDVQALLNRPIAAFPDSSRLPRLKRFRFQLLHQWLSQTFPPCAAADIGGGKGLLAYLLQSSGWQVTVIDPHQQPLPDKYKDILTGARCKIPPEAAVANLPQAFETSHGAGFELLIGLHAHGCNAKIIDAAAAYGCGFAIFPCCVIDEPFYPPAGVHWLESLANYAVRAGLPVQTTRLNFKGQNIGLYARGRL